MNVFQDNAKQQIFLFRENITIRIATQYNYTLQLYSYSHYNYNIIDQLSYRVYNM